MTARGPAIPAQASEAHSGDAGRWLVPAIAIGTTLAPLNSTMIAVALPDIQRSFGDSVTATALLVTIYLVAMAVGQPIGGRLGDLFGRRRVYLLGLVWFAVASAGCAFAPTLEWLIVFRTQQALAGALSFPNGAAMVREAVAPGRRGSAFGVVGMATGLAAASGPPLGGALVHAFGWPAIFWVNVPVVGTAILLGWRSLPKRTTDRVRPPFDVVGSGLLAASLGAVIVIPTLLRASRPMPAAVAALACLGLGAAFVRWELRAPAPVVDVRLFAQSHFAAACASIGLSNLVMYTTLLALPLYLAGVRGLGVQVAGAVLVALSAFSALWGPVGGRWTDTRGRWLPAVAGAAILLLGTVMLSVAVRGGDGLRFLAAALATMGLGLGMAAAPVQTAAVEAAPMQDTGSAAGIFSTARYLGSVTGSTILAVAFVAPPLPGEADRFVLLFAGLSVVALAGIAVNARVAER